MPQFRTVAMVASSPPTRAHKFTFERQQHNSSTMLLSMMSGSGFSGNNKCHKDKAPEFHFHRAARYDSNARSLSCVWHGRGDALICFWIWPVMRCVWHCFLSSLVVLSFRKSGTANRDPSYTPAGILCIRLSLVSGSSEWKVRVEAAGYVSTANDTLTEMGLWKTLKRQRVMNLRKPTKDCHLMVASRWLMAH